MKIALLMNLAPRKLGSFEAWLLAFCKEALWRGHEVTLFGRRPVHPKFIEDLSALSVSYEDLKALEADPVRAVKTLSRFDVLHLDLVAPRSRAALAAYAAVPAKVLYVAHSDHLPDGGSAPKRLIRSFLDRATSLRIDAFAGVSDFVREKERARFGFPPEKCRTLYNGVDLERFKTAESPREEGAPLELITVAYLIRPKGVHLLIEAFSKLANKNTRLTVVGDGPEEVALRQQADELGVADRVRFLGLRDDVPALVSRADVFVHNATAEAFGLTIAEAMAAGRAVIATRVGGVPEVIEDGVSGVLVPRDDVPALSAALTRLCDSAELRQSFGEAARSRVRLKFSLRGSVARHLDWCEEILGKPSLVRAALERAGLRAGTVLSGKVPVQPTTPWPAAEPVRDPASAPAAERPARPRAEPAGPSDPPGVSTH